MSRLKRASEVQKEFLISYMENNVAFSQERFDGPDWSHTRTETWNGLSEHLNRLEGAVKDPQKWRKFWSDQKIHIQEKEALLQSAFERSGINGPVKLKPLTELERRVLQLIVPAAVSGNNNVAEVFTIQEVVVKDEHFEDYNDQSNSAVESATASTSRNTPDIPITVKPHKRRHHSLPKSPESSNIEERLLEIEEEKLVYAKMKYELKRDELAAEEMWKKRYLDLENKKLKLEEKKYELEKEKFEYQKNSEL